MNKNRIKISILLTTVIVAIVLSVNLITTEEVVNSNKDDGSLSSKISDQVRNENITVVSKDNIENNDESRVTKADEGVEKPFITDCGENVQLNEMVNNKYGNETNINITNGLDSLIPVLEESNQIDSKLSHALITGKSSIEDLTNKLSELNQNNPDHSLLSYDLLSACTSNDSNCNREQINDAVELDNQNGAVWLLSTIYDLNNNNFESAKEALIEAANAPIYNEYWGEHFTLFEAAFSQAGAGTDMPTQLAVLDNISSVPLPNFSVITSFCKNTDLSQIEILESCLAIGKRLVDNQGNMLSHMIGLSLQKEVYTKYENEYEISLIKKQEKEFHKNMKLSEKALNLHLRSHQRVADWLNNIRYSGEVYTSEYIVDEAIRVSSDPEFDPCKIDW